MEVCIVGLFMLGRCYILSMCGVGVSYLTTMSDDPSHLRCLCRVRRALSYGSTRGIGFLPPYIEHSRQNFEEKKIGAVFVILAFFAIFSGFLN